MKFNGFKERVNYQTTLYKASKMINPLIDYMNKIKDIIPESFYYYLIGGITPYFMIRATKKISLEEVKYLIDEISETLQLTPETTFENEIRAEWAISQYDASITLIIEYGRSCNIEYITEDIPKSKIIKTRTITKMDPACAEKLKKLKDSFKENKL